MTKDDFPVMLASPFKEIDRIQFPCIAQTKMDGMRAMIVKRDGRVTVYSRNGNTMVKLDQHFEGFLATLDNVVLDGELTVLDESGKLLDRKAGNGICHKSVESVATISDEEVKRIRITLWDIIDVKEFDLGKSSDTGVQRLERLAQIPKHRLFEIVETFEVENLEAAQDLFKTMLSKGQEGIILKNKHHPWENKRSKHIVKMKEVIETDMKIIGFAEGTGKASGMLGALQCENNDGTIRVDVGTGFTDEQRKDIWARREHLLNTIVTIKHNGVITRKGGKTKSMFLPVFVELRPDKDVAD